MSDAFARFPAQLLSAAIALVGVAAFRVLSLPLPFLLGPLAACLVAALAGVRLADTGRVGVAMRTVLGIAVGAAITPELLTRLPGMAFSVALVPLFVLAIGLVGYPFFRRVCRFDGPTAFYAAMPGGLQDMVVFGEEAGADVRALSLVHATRVLVIVSAMPLALPLLFDVGLDRPPGAPLAAVPPAQLALMLGAAALGWWGAARVGLFGAAILGPLIVATLLGVTGLLEHRPPAEAILAAQFFIGTSLGARYTGVTRRELRVDVLAGLGFCVLIGALSVAFATLAARAGWAPALEALLAFSPGGQAEMAVLTIIVGADLAFVITHHLLRLVVVIVGAPLVGHVFDWRSTRDTHRRTR